MPVDEAPPNTDVGERVTEETAGGLTVRFTVWDGDPVNDPVIVTLICAATACEVTVKVCVVLPPMTVTGVGTDAAAGLLLATVTAIPPVGAGPVSVNVPVGFVVKPPVTTELFTVTEASIGELTVSVAVFDMPRYVAVITGLAETAIA